jgi:hypothetical protein
MATMLDTFDDTPGDEKIEVSLDHRTFIILKDPGHPTVAVLCVVGAPGTRNDFALASSR